MKFKDINIVELLPQQPPFVMIDALEHCDEVFTRTSLVVKPDNIFVENNEFTESGIIENVAQTCAARMGYANKYVSNDGIKIGFIGSISNMVFNRLPKVEDEIKTTIEIVSEVFSVTLVNAKVEVGGELIASCEMKIAITDMDLSTDCTD